MLKETLRNKTKVEFEIIVIASTRKMLDFTVTKYLDIQVLTMQNNKIVHRILKDN